MTEPDDALRAALEAAGLSVQAIPEEQRAMFASLTDEEVTRLITLRTGNAGGIGGTGGTAPEPVPPGSAPSRLSPSEPEAGPAEPEGSDPRGEADRAR